jgi:hypothetical protein
MWVVCYEHRHGTDLSLCTTEEKALRTAVEYILVDIRDIDHHGTRREILKAVMTFNYEDAIAAWAAWNGRTATEESINIAELPVDKYLTEAIKLKGIAKKLLEETNANSENNAEERLSPRGT